MTAPWNTRSALMALLDALEADMLAAPKPEMEAALRETGRARDGAIYELRLLVRDAQADRNDSLPLSTPWDAPDGVGTRRH